MEKSTIGYIKKYWNIIEALLFIGVFLYTFSGHVSGFWQYCWQTLHGKGFITDFNDPFKKHIYWQSFLAVIMLFVSLFTILEIILLVIHLLKESKQEEWNKAKYKKIFDGLRLRYQPTFLIGMLLGYIPLIIKIDVFLTWMDFFHKKLSFFTINLEWYSWIYAYFIWELSTWVWHYSVHKVRLLWCLHSPHHAPAEINMTVGWVHFFAEGYFTSIVQLTILMLLGVNPKMMEVILVIEAVYGTFIHTGERVLKTGKLGFLHHFFITPSHHRVHHAKNPLYLDTNYCTLLPFWDWLFGTLQPIREDIHLQCGIKRKMDVSSFVDVYFGEIAYLYRDLKNASSWKVRFLHLIMPPGWTPEHKRFLAKTVRNRYLEKNPNQLVNNRNKIFLMFNQLFKRQQNDTFSTTNTGLS